MSAKVAAKSTATELTDKFAKELNKFFVWAKDAGYEIMKGDGSVEWSLKLIKGFEEPGRNKLDAYIKVLLKKYTISKDNEDIDDYKVILKDFKDNKPKRKRKRADTSTEGESASTTVVVDNNLDTSEIYYLDTLDVDTNTLLKKLGKPVKKNGENNGFEWKVKVGDNVYSIHDWVNEEGEFDSFEDTWWYVGGVNLNKADIKQNKADIKTIISFLGEKDVKKQKPEKKAAKKEETDVEDEPGTDEYDESSEGEEMNNAKASLEETEDLFGEISDMDDDLDLETVEDE